MASPPDATIPAAAVDNIKIHTYKNNLKKYCIKCYMYNLVKGTKNDNYCSYIIG